MGRPANISNPLHPHAKSRALSSHAPFPPSQTSFTSTQTHQLRPPSGGNNPNLSAYPSCSLGTPSSTPTNAAAAPRQSLPQSGTEVSRRPKVTIETREASKSPPTRYKNATHQFPSGNAMPCHAMPSGRGKGSKTASNCRFSRLRELTRPSTPSTSMSSAQSRLQDVLFQCAGCQLLRGSIAACEGTGDHCSRLQKTGCLARRRCVSRSSNVTFSDRQPKIPTFGHVCSTRQLTVMSEPYKSRVIVNRPDGNL